MTTEMPGPRLPTAADEDRFWSLIESAWASLGPEPAAIRHRLLHRGPDHDEGDLYSLGPWLDPFLDRLRAMSADLSSIELTDLDRVLERKLFDIDRADVQEVTDGSDDGFLYARGYIVASGRAFYEAVKADPEVAIVDAEHESMCYFFDRVHREKFGDHTETGSGISRESGSNQSGWL
ncbi:DUF4240 domain-containing protein [Actinoplanes sp. G11-F43]|uniref:DUF4240 domain-containing protein n=1 Tax=Actinoplanes sp. G11-F43 TaxID=3424130 RepID=UPI003D34B928